jgi:hypothetical protein
MDIAVHSQRLLGSMLELCASFPGECRRLSVFRRSLAGRPTLAMSLPASQNLRIGVTMDRIKDALEDATKDIKIR